MVLRSSSTDFRRLHVRDTVQGMVPQTLLWILGEYLQSHGVPPESVIPQDVLQPTLQPDRQPHLQPHSPHLGRFPAEAFCQLLLRAAERLQDPLLGLHLGQSIRPAHLGALGYALLACENLGAALLRIQRYHRLLHDINPVEYHLEGDSVVLQWGVGRGKPGALFDEMGIVGIGQCVQALCGRVLVARAVDFVNPGPRHKQAFVDYFGCPVRWDQPATRLVIGLDMLQTPLRQPDPVLRGLMEAQIDVALAALPEAGDLVDLTRKVVQQLARQGVPELEQVAAELRLSPRVFARRLAERGHPFRQVREASLQALAESYLTDKRLSMAEVRERMGYAEQSAFSRAFKRWSGVSPLAWRRSQGK